MAVEDDILATLKNLLAIQQVEYNYDQTRYLAAKVRAGQAYFSKTWVYIPLGAGASTTVTITNPAGYISIWHWLQGRTSQNGVIEITVMKDDSLEPWLYVPRAVDMDLNITALVPYDLIMNDHISITFTNHDALAQWGVIGDISTFVRKDVWEADLAVMNKMAQQFAMTGVPLPPPAS